MRDQVAERHADRVRRAGVCAVHQRRRRVGQHLLPHAAERAASDYNLTMQPPVVARLAAHAAAHLEPEIGRRNGLLADAILTAAVGRLAKREIAGDCPAGAGTLLTADFGIDENGESDRSPSIPA